MNKTALELRKINKIYKGKTENIHILKDLDLKVSEGEFISILGKSGSGKSTLLNVIGMLDSIDNGEIFIEEKKIDRGNEKDIDEIKNKKIGFVFQFHYLLPEFTALENVMLPALLKGEDKKKAEEKAKKLLEEVGLGERLHHKPSELSGGEKQRAAISRALINDPEILLADEPTSALDVTIQAEVVREMKKLREQYETAIILVTHNMGVASYISDKIGVMCKGELVEFGKRDDVIFHPKHEYTKKLLAAVPRLEGKRFAK